MISWLWKKLNDKKCKLELLKEALTQIEVRSHQFICVALMGCVSLRKKEKFLGFPAYYLIDKSRSELSSCIITKLQNRNALDGYLYIHPKFKKHLNVFRIRGVMRKIRITWLQQIIHAVANDEPFPSPDNVIQEVLNAHLTGE